MLPACRRLISFSRQKEKNSQYESSYQILDLEPYGNEELQSVASFSPKLRERPFQKPVTGKYNC